MVTKREDDTSGTASSGRLLTSAEARQAAADRQIGERTLLALRLVMIISLVVFVTIGILTDPRSDDPIIDSLSLGLVTLEVWILPGIAGLIAVIACRRPARHQVDWLTYTIFCSGAAGAIPGVVGLAVGFYHLALVAIAVCGIALICGLSTLVLLRVWRVR